MLSVAEVMTAQPYTLRPDDSLTKAASLMREHHIRHIPIVSNDGNVIGMVSHRDLLAASDSRLVHEDMLAGGKENYVALSAVMSSPVQTVNEDAELRSVAGFLRKQRLGCLPVMRDDELVGIITDSDFLEVAIVLMEQLEMVEPEDDF
ncbi:MAG: CBS domain-containing membrane protein [Glaciecola sp.]|jgi:CBS domain-containing membrane protein|uniref:CBS domain-containing protein n=1 Tax=Congregibacter sp. TaxID=2744308 RepID=UPI0039E7111C